MYFNEFSYMMNQMEQMLKVALGGYIGAYAVIGTKQLWLPYLKDVLRSKKKNPIPFEDIGLVKNNLTPVLVKAIPDKCAYIYDLPTGMTLSDVQSKQEAIEFALKAPIVIKTTNNYLVEIKIIKAKYDNKYYLDFSNNLLKGMSFHIGKTLEDEDVVLKLTSSDSHVLVMGATGSGKSVCMNNLMLQLVLKKHLQHEPIELNVIDQKRGVEFAVFKNYIDRLAKDDQQAFGLVKYLHHVMMSRYELFEKQDIKDITEYNQIHKKEPLENIVLVIDEFAALEKPETKKKKKNEEPENDTFYYLDKLLFLGRACGIFIIIATQFPSAEIIPSKMKRNLTQSIKFGDTPDNVNDLMSDKVYGKPSGEGMLKENGKNTDFKGYFSNTKIIQEQLKKVKPIVHKDDVQNKTKSKVIPMPTQAILYVPDEEEKEKTKKAPILPVEREINNSWH